MREQYMRCGEGFIICYSITDRLVVMMMVVIMMMIVLMIIVQFHDIYFPGTVSTKRSNTGT